MVLRKSSRSHGIFTAGHGSPVQGECNANRYRASAGFTVGGIIGIVPKVKDLDQRLARTEQQLRLLQKISRCMVREMSLQAALDGVVTLVVDFMECDSCLLYLLADHELVLRASNRPHPTGAWQRQAGAERRPDRLGGAREALAVDLARRPIATPGSSSSPICRRIPTKPFCPRPSFRATAWRA
jgi:hypothetical protein